MSKIIIVFLSTFFCAISFAGQPTKDKMNHPKPLGTQSTSSTYKVQEQLFETWLPWANKYRNSDKVTYSYNALQYLIYDNDYGWDTVANKWTNNTADSFVYDAMNRQTMRITKTWESTAFKNTSQITDSFSGNTKTETNYSWDSTKWLPQFRDIYSLNSNGKDTLDINHGYNNSTWENVTKYQSTYNTGGKITLKNTSQWTGSKWQLTEKEETYYDGNNNDTLYVHQSYDSSTTKWSYVFVQESKNTYDGAGNLIKVIQNGSYDNINWMPFAQYNYGYDINKNDTLYTVQQWDSVSKSWVNNARYSMTYKVFTGIENASIKVNPTQVYPNPARGFSTISFELTEPKQLCIVIYDINGKIVQAKGIKKYQVGANHEIIDVSTLSSGIYYIKLQNNLEVFKTSILQVVK